MAKLGVALVGALLALCLLLPGHSPPWMSSWHEGLAAVALALLAVLVLLRRGLQTCGWRGHELVVALLVLLPPAQFVLGKIPLFQTAWMHSAYFLGLLVAMVVGAALERRERSASLRIVSFAFLAAALISVAIQFYQWLILQPGESPLWVYRATAGRPAANLGQPNQLATLLVLASLGAFVLWRTRRAPAVLVMAMVIALSVGIALTQSRAGLLNATLVGATLAGWTFKRGSPRTAGWLIALLVVVWASFFIYPALQRHFASAAEVPSLDVAERMSTGVRPLAWKTFGAAVMHQPWTGYGWGQIFEAQLTVALEQPPLHRVFLNPHNLFLEFALTIGLPAALALGAGVLAWLVVCAKKIDDDDGLLMLLFVGVLLMHAMVEFPLHYAYFLLPAGLIAGALGERVRLRVVVRAMRWQGPALVALSCAALTITIADYVRVEPAYRLLLLEKARIVIEGDRSPPDVLVLTSLRDLIEVARVQSQRGLSRERVDWIRDVAATHPGSVGVYAAAAALTLSGRVAEAQDWIDRSCQILATAHCRMLAEHWQEEARAFPELGAVRWPVE